MNGNERIEITWKNIGPIYRITFVELLGGSLIEI